ncbi:MAG: ureE [Verrucomicrobiales bacterium]|nr:ureE [Verrucomicrobiales bacterium]
MHMIRGPGSPVRHDVRRVQLYVDRFTLAKRRWRATAEDGVEFGFDLDSPLRNGICFFQDGALDYCIHQTSEPVLSVALLSIFQSAKIAWNIGNLHFPLSLSDGYILVEDDPALRQLFERERIMFEKKTAIFQPLQGAQSHKH